MQLQYRFNISLYYSNKNILFLTPKFQLHDEIEVFTDLDHGTYYFVFLISSSSAFIRRVFTIFSSYFPPNLLVK